MSAIGKSVNRIDAISKVTGEAKYPGDYNLPEQLYMKVLFSGIPHGIVKKIETKKAEEVPGVVAILTAKDVPNNEYGLITADQPVLCGPGSNRPFADRVRFIGDQVALVIAETEESAEIARKLIKVEFEELEIISNVEKACTEDSFLVHPDRGSNTFCHYRIRKGDPEKIKEGNNIVVEGVYRTPIQEHAYLQPEAGIGYYDQEGRITVVVAGQWVHEDQEQIAHALNLPLEKIRVIYPSIGGAFGGREDMSVQIILALAVLKLKEKGIERPVKIVWSREESIIGHHKRHPYIIKMKLGASKTGKINFVEVEILADGGAYIYTSTKVLGNATLLCTGPYNIPNVKVDSYAIYTNNIPNGAFRGFGGPQVSFAIEIQMDKLAERLNIDPVEFRLRNIIKEGDLLSVGTPLPKGVTIEKAIIACAEKAGWKKDKEGHYSITKIAQNDIVNRRGIGFACGYKNIGFSYGAPEQCWAVIELHGKNEIDKVILRHAGAEVGQGAHTVFVQMAAKGLDISMDKIELIASDTAYTLNSGSVSASRMTFMAGNAIKGAAKIALDKWDNGDRPAIAEYQYKPPKTTPFDPETGKCEPNFAYGYVAEAIVCDVDIETGLVGLKNVICADDVGRAINPQLVEGQVEGAVVQALGYTILENFIQKDGLVYTNKFSTYLIPTVMDIPEKIDSIILEYPDLVGPWGARGVGEMPFLPFAPALISAVHSATNKWFDEFPLTPECVYKKILEDEL
ncbi:MAG: molybdopterin-dependent oxidoreductase [Chloroflexi bacterium]|nr:molybdopterin-dependent oxidoreductase [Chloroflexota bacterium]